MKRKAIRCIHFMIGVAVVLTAGIILDTVYTFGFERLSPVSVWFQYDKEKPIVSLAKSYDADQHARFHSNSTYYRALKMEWFDSMYCVTPTGIQVLGAQYWQEFVTPHVEASDKSWLWEKAPFPVDAIKCQVRSNAVGTTPQWGFIKSSKQASNWFDINQKQGM